ncbi:MAG: hypothetical protein GXY55_05360 [Phycisphaerae bacterium]|nr:hypothetical protein [Phycisphaerae bacterium]
MSEPDASPDSSQQSSPVCSLPDSAEVDRPQGRRRRIWLGGLIALLPLGVFLCASLIWVENHRTRTLLVMIVAAGGMTITLLDMFWWKRRAAATLKPSEP